MVGPRPSPERPSAEFLGPLENGAGGGGMRTCRPRCDVHRVSRYTILLTLRRLAKLWFDESDNLGHIELLMLDPAPSDAERPLDDRAPEVIASAAAAGERYKKQAQDYLGLLFGI